MLRDLWATIQGKSSAVPHPNFFSPSLPDIDDTPEPITTDLPKWEAQELSGAACIIHYSDSRGQLSQRRVTCQRLDQAKEQLYLHAWCHERAAHRMFRTDRISVVIDIITGEIFEPGAIFFANFQPSSTSAAGITWGLSVKHRADLLAALNVLTFLANCDKDWHPAERERIEQFVTSFWIRGEFRHDPPMDAIMARADRMAPDAETFYVSLDRCGRQPLIAPSIQRAIGDVIAADGRIHEHEFYWGQQVDAYFRSLS